LKLKICGHVTVFVSAGEESGVSLFKRELEAEMATKRDEQVLVATE